MKTDDDKIRIKYENIRDTMIVLALALAGIALVSANTIQRVPRSLLCRGSVIVTTTDNTVVPVCIEWVIR